MKINNGQTEFDSIIVDADKFLIIAAKAVQEDYIQFTHKVTGVTGELPNTTSLWGSKRSGFEGSEAGFWFNFIGAKVKREDIIIEYKSRLRDDIQDHLEEAKKQFAYKVKDIKDLPYADSYKLCLGGEDNFRYSVANILPYKGERKEKPIVFSDLKEEIFSQYKNHVVISNGYESDDKLGMFAAENQQHFRKTGKYKWLLAYEDKDLNQLWGPHVNFRRFEEGILWITPEEACKNFCSQMLKGDLTVDNIQGLPNLTDECRELYGIKKSSGIGPVAVEKLLADLETPKDMLQRVVDVYKDYFKEPVTFTTHRKEEVTYTWKDYFEENARLLWMLRNEDVNWDVWKDLLDKLGVNYD